MMNMRVPTGRLITFLICLVCGAGFAMTVQGQQQSPPIWDRSGIPPAQRAAAGGQASSANKAGSEGAWERYSSGGEEFSALLPEPPLRFYVLRPEKPFEERRGGWLYTAYADGTVYAVWSFYNPKGKESLEVFVNNFQELHRRMTFEREVSLNGFKGKQYRYVTGTGGIIDGIVQIYPAKDHAYIFEVASDKTGNPSVERFLSSLTLNGKTKGKEIAELSGSEANQGEEQSKVLNPKEVTSKAVIIVKPSPEYTEEARQHEISGTVTVRAVLSSSGHVTSIRPVSDLPYGLTEKAVAAARNIRFIPAVKDGRYVSQYVTIEYNFNIY